MVEFDKKLNNLWLNPNNVNLESCFIYFICVRSPEGLEYSYIGKARSESRLREYRRNMAKIRKGRERGLSQGYRGVHFFLYKALLEDWEIDFYPIENCSKEELNDREQQHLMKEAILDYFIQNGYHSPSKPSV